MNPLAPLLTMTARASQPTINEYGQTSPGQWRDLTRVYWERSTSKRLAATSQDTTITARLFTLPDTVLEEGDLVDLGDGHTLIVATAASHSLPFTGAPSHNEYALTRVEAAP